MQLRIYRTFTWGYTGRIQDMRMGSGGSQLSLIAHDELQYLPRGINVTDLDWLPVPIVEAEKPEHPNAEKNRLHMEQIQIGIDQIFAARKSKSEEI